MGQDTATSSRSSLLPETECRLCGWIGSFICGRCSGSSIKSSADSRTLLLPELFCSYLSIRFYCDSSASYNCTWPAHLCTTCSSSIADEVDPTDRIFPRCKSPRSRLWTNCTNTRALPSSNGRLPGRRAAMQRAAREPRTFWFKLALLLLGPGGSHFLDISCVLFLKRLCNTLVVYFVLLS